MKAPKSLRRWTSTATPTTQAVELESVPNSSSELEAALAAVALPDISEAAFVLVRLGVAEGQDLRKSIVVANRSQLGRRLCLVIDRATLRLFDPEFLDDERVGIVLDDVDEHTPPSAFVEHSIEAIRLHSDFVYRAERDLRVGCVLDSVLSLAANLGLCTLGPPSAIRQPSLDVRHTFDFVVAPSSGTLGPSRRPARPAPTAARSGHLGL